jgi:hypothetical protein
MYAHQTLHIQSQTSILEHNTDDTFLNFEYLVVIYKIFFQIWILQAKLGREQSS